MKNCLLKNSSCTFLMDRKGAAKLPEAGAEYDASIYADCFIISGLSRYSTASGDIGAYEFARRLLRFSG